MTDLPSGSIIAQGGALTISSIRQPPQYLTIGQHVRISLDDGGIEYGDGYEPDEAARTFWEAMSNAYGIPARQKAASVDRPFPHGFARVQGRCPACRMSALFLGDGGYVTCGNLQCTNPCAANDMLEAQS